MPAALKPSLVVLILLLSLPAAGCAPPPQSPTPLPTPLLHSAPLPSATPPPPTAAPAASGGAEETPAEAQEAAPGQTPADLARAAYAGRLVEAIHIAAIGVEAPVTAVGWTLSLEDEQTLVWDSPEAQVGWALGSALPDERSGNIILYGHNNIHSSVFKRLYELQAGDQVMLRTAQREWKFEIDQVKILPVLEKEADAAAYAEYLKPSRAPRLTLISCWPPDNNTHRVIVIAYPILH